MNTTNTAKVNRLIKDESGKTLGTVQGPILSGPHKGQFAALDRTRGRSFHETADQAVAQMKQGRA